MTNLRHQLDTLAADARSYGDGSAAIRTARRRRSVRQAAIAGAAALVVAGSATLWAQTGRTTATPLPPATGPTVIYYRDGSVLATFLQPEGWDRPVGLVARHVLSELTFTEGTALTGKSWEEIRHGGYEIVTTIDPAAQFAVEAAADARVEGSFMADQPELLATAAVVVEPGTGRVLAYYGGPEGTGNDYAGIYHDERGEVAGFGRHAPGGSFMVYTLAAALGADISLNSRWQWTEHPQPGRPVDNPVRNGDRTCPDSPNGLTCSLLDSVGASLSVPLYDVTLSASPVGVLDAARDAGIDTIWNDDLERFDLRTLGAEATAAGNLGVEVGIGQYGVTVLDQANAMATYAAGGLRARAHFVSEVRRSGEVVYGETLPSPDAERVLDPGQVADLTYALTRISGQDDLALKPGEWAYAGGDTAYSHAWSVGFTSTVAVAVWVGNAEIEQPLLDSEGAPIDGAGLPTQILREVVADTQTVLGLSPTPFPPPVFGGQLLPAYAWPS